MLSGADEDRIARAVVGRQAHTVAPLEPKLPSGWRFASGTVKVWQMIRPSAESSRTTFPRKVKPGYSGPKTRGPKKFSKDENADGDVVADHRRGADDHLKWVLVPENWPGLGGRWSSARRRSAHPDHEPDPSCRRR